MMPLMNELHEDHQHIRSLLTLLRNKLGTVALGQPVNFKLMAEAVDYLCDYADRFHHRKETRVFEFLRRWYPESTAQVNRQLHEHVELEAATAQLRQTLGRIKSGDAVAEKDFPPHLERFMDKQLRHLTREEERLFPLIERTLTPDNWLHFQATAPELDRTGERQLAERYQALCEALIKDLH
ncbi:hemerythrin domain-containing protein [Motiliproteus sp. SC1-56]|uniref:hemerythrin domain-containing protein n=1 Tax=Motiliproteus sp. SC1-56 TaxID=2799565 RepID=UPI001A8DFB25|nr:hemerythrin domain-containing protein [Motiliproteus sp. SC1-56]